jgi:integrase/recombinase XerD
VSARAACLQAWFTDRLIRERNASPHTIASYRDTIRLLLTYASQRLGVEPSRLDLGQLNAPLIGAFLDHLETDRGCSARTRNTRLAAIRTFNRYCLLRHPEHAATIERVLQIGAKRYERALVTYLTEPELDALIDAPDRSSWTGRRDHAIITLLAQTGLRASELTGLACGEIHLGTGAHVATTGKGRKRRITPLTKDTAALLRAWLDERGGSPAEPLFPTSTGKPLTRKALARRITKHATRAAEQCPSVAAKTITPHVLRHTAAMRLLHADVDTTVIALWLGHEQGRNHADVPPRRPRGQRTSAGPHQAVEQQTRAVPPARRAPPIPGWTVTTSCRFLCLQRPRRGSRVGTARLRFWRNEGARAAAPEHVEAVETIEEGPSRAEC